MCLTNSPIGMPEPIKVTQIEDLAFEKVLEDIYHLSFMNIHSVLKSRLPV
jgi:hypothetical protein